MLSKGEGADKEVEKGPDPTQGTKDPISIRTVESQLKAVYSSKEVEVSWGFKGSGNCGKKDCGGCTKKSV